METIGTIDYRSLNNPLKGLIYGLIIKAPIVAEILKMKPPRKPKVPNEVKPERQQKQQRNNNNTKNNSTRNNDNSKNNNNNNSANAKAIAWRNHSSC